MYKQTLDRSQASKRTPSFSLRLYVTIHRRNKTKLSLIGKNADESVSYYRGKIASVPATSSAAVLVPTTEKKLPNKNPKKEKKTRTIFSIVITRLPHGQLRESGSVRRGSEKLIQTTETESWSIFFRSRFVWEGDESPGESGLLVNSVLNGARFQEISTPD